MRAREVTSRIHDLPDQGPGHQTESTLSFLAAGGQWPQISYIRSSPSLQQIRPAFFSSRLFIAADLALAGRISRTNIDISSAEAPIPLAPRTGHGAQCLSHHCPSLRQEGGCGDEGILREELSHPFFIPATELVEPGLRRNELSHRSTPSTRTPGR